MGRFNISFANLLALIWSVITGSPYDTTDFTVVFLIRFPRVLVALCVGIVLSLDGVAFQGIFKNPLASSQILGVSFGAGFGAAFAIVVLNTTGWIVQFSAFMFGVIAVTITYLISKLVNSKSNYSLLLCGLVTGTFFSALISILTFVADPRNQLPSLVFWQMGSLNRIQIADIFIIGIPTLVLSLFAYIFAWRFNILTLGDNESKNLGMNPYITKGVVITVVILCTSITISLVGTIGWVGLLVPHAVRLMVGNDNKKVIPISIFIGAIFLMIVDTMSRSLFEAEIPIGIIINLLGAPLFALCLFLNYKKRNSYVQ